MWRPHIGRADMNPQCLPAGWVRHSAERADHEPATAIGLDDPDREVVEGTDGVRGAKRHAVSVRRPA